MSESDSDPSSDDSYFKLSKEELDKRRKALRQLVENELARRYALPRQQLHAEEARRERNMPTTLKRTRIMMQELV